MNYLAHLYLSGPEPGVKVGNFIGDYVKGKRYLRYPPEIRKGILLHRQIDSFADAHPVLRKDSIFFKPRYARYAGVVMDVVYDHFLASNWNKYSDQSLSDFVSDTHRLLFRFYFSLPTEVKRFLPFLVQSRRLEYYKYPEGVEMTLRLMSSHSSLPDHSLWARTVLNDNYEELKSSFFVLFDDVKEMARKYLAEAEIS